MVFKNDGRIGNTAFSATEALLKCKKNDRCRKNRYNVQENRDGWASLIWEHGRAS